MSSMHSGTRRLFDDLRSTRVVLIHGPGEDCEILVGQLRRIGCPIRTVWPFPNSAPSDADVLFFQVTPELRDSAHWIFGEERMTLVALSSYEDPTTLKLLLDTQAHGVITKPYRSSGILTTLMLARSAYGYQQRLHSKVRKLEETIKARRQIEKAVRLLAEQQQLTDAQAYEHMRARATSLRVTVAEVATLVIEAAEAMAKLGLAPPGRRI